MKPVAIVGTLILLSACTTTQETFSCLDESATEEQQLQARECEYKHGGAVRGCNEQRSAATRSATLMDQCVTGAYAELRTCYRACE